MKTISIKIGDGASRIQVEVDREYPNYCMLSIHSPDDDSIQVEIETAEILHLATEVLKEIG